MRSQFYTDGKLLWYRYIYGMKLPWHRYIYARLWRWIYK